MKTIDVVPRTRTLVLPRPDVLADQAAEAVREILAEAASANTTRSYATALRYWAAWFQGRFGQPLRLPVPDAAVVQFVVDHLARRTKAGLAWRTQARRIRSNSAQTSGVGLSGVMFGPSIWGDQ